MLDRDKVILMTKMAAFEQREGRRTANMNQYFRSDYVGYQILKSIISATIVYFILAGAYALFNFESVIQQVYSGRWMALLQRIGVIYVVLIGVYAVVSYIVYSYRYSKMRGRLKEYYGDLKTLYEIIKRNESEKE